MKKMNILPMAITMMMSFAITAEHWPTGYYATVADPNDAYFYNDENRWYCHVQNATQASLYDVQDQLRVVGDVSSFLGQAVSLNECPWPNGFFQVAGGGGPVYRLYPGNICTITSDQMLAAYGGTDYVIEAEDGSDFGSQRTDIGQCFWPSYDVESSVEQH